jgi:pimeloyl-ACP methyl ester carboxylesterase
MRGRIAGVASISYRLSPHPKYQQERAPDRDDSDRVRNARHPDHIDDVRAALKFLDTHYGFDGTFSYVLVGHSVGATMGLQYVMELPREKGRGRMGPFPGPEPHAVVGVEGLYDLRGLVKRCGDGYREFIAGAYGEEEELWGRMSPALFKGNWLEDSRTYNRLCHLVVLGWSPDDELVDGTEIDVMEETLRNGYFGVTRVFRDLEGSHDGVVEDGEAIARVLISTVEELDKIQDRLGRPDLHRAMARRSMANGEAASSTQGRFVVNTPQKGDIEEVRD